MNRLVGLVTVVSLMTLVGVAGGCGGESTPTPTPTPTAQEVYLKAVQRWAYGLSTVLEERELYQQEPSAILEAALMDPLVEDRPSWFTLFDGTIRALEPLYLDPEVDPSAQGVPVPRFENRVNGIKDRLRTMIREWTTWKADPYGNVDAFQRLADFHVAAFRDAEQLNLDAIKAINTGDY